MFMPLRRKSWTCTAATHHASTCEGCVVRRGILSTVRICGTTSTEASWRSELRRRPSVTRNCSAQSATLRMNSPELLERTTSPMSGKRPNPSIERIHRSEEHTSELQSPDHLVCRLLLEKKKSCIQLTLDTMAIPSSRDD